MKGRRGKPPSGVRPTTAKVLESMMAILAPYTEDARAVDIFAGTGEVGFRLLQGGAASVLFVEGEPRVAGALRARIRESQEAAQCSLVIGRVPKILTRLEGRYDLFLADPPYDWTEPESLMEALANHAGEGALLVVEHHHKTLYASGHGWQPFRTEKYGESRLSFFRYESLVGESLVEESLVGERGVDALLVDKADESENATAEG